MQFTVPSYAKINWWLEIRGRRLDGFHEVETVLQTVDLHDELRFSPRSSGIVLETFGRPVESGEANLVVRAARLLSSVAGRNRGIDIILDKRIPIGAGLGGGSSNAAVTLLALNHIWSCGLDLDRLLALSAELGSDVPFFIRGGTALGLGRGERIVRCKDLDFEQPLLLTFPGFMVSTELAYSLLDSSSPDSGEILTTRAPDTTIRRFQGIMGRRDWKALRNDFEGPVFEKFPCLQDLRQALLCSGCQRVMLSGSGSTLAALGDPRALKKAELELSGQTEVETFGCRPLTHQEYFGALQSSGLKLDF